MKRPAVFKFQITFKDVKTGKIAKLDEDELIGMEDILESILAKGILEVMDLSATEGRVQLRQEVKSLV